MRGHFFRQGGCHGGHAMGHRDGSGRGFGGRGFGGRGFFGGGRGEGFGGREGFGREGRGFGHGGLRLVLLKLISEKPSHGYELIKDIEERFKGGYSPSPGVVYPTLSWLEDEGYISIAAGEDGRKQASITDAGKAFLNEKAEDVERLFDRMNDDRSGHGDYSALFRAMGNLGAAVKVRGMRPLDQSEINTIVDMIDELAKKIERS
ncbi:MULTISPECIES: PadR family transcriptional regulator [Asticcacaulis]|uniref:PadR family transcriptional regulator n=1 Tax=Asticcacaulis TaxID=76890 RepID=UPI001FDA34D6|nr:MULTISPECIES: PadR family transcriptional regulator [Asticcacaulis]MBP2158869.1 DNA-binding PadR family transcriptional regulator [Asticcacaulis solisilvae]MDR6799914.1 DNA-binding PadR family transcriptional regulator [Asticcacaulis sp. BE141]